ncbi:DUF2497 domain-containing protein [Aestuariivirga litoralis]|uniref:DUF2497 domain-containing protein n=1 Tax=Aestuariivirga litoralis TaxID=2650924 RepID=UPI0018C51DA4|nr:DUF2497 domain-containing protein [Aestuariivirga litoralis]MBG1231338.1 DUF2497 domain-containing protein [Aestuariivirga litoralis]
MASIRRAIDHDISELDRRAQEGSGSPAAARAKAEPPAPLRGTLNEFQNKYASSVMPDADADIAKLRRRVKHNRLEETPPAPPQKPNLQPDRSSAFSTILSTPQRAEPKFRPAPAAPPPVVEELPPESYDAYDSYDQGVWQEQQAAAEQQGYYPPAVSGYIDPQNGLMSPDSAYAAQGSFQALAELAMARVGGDAGLQAMTRDILHQLLREWLDRNLPPLVEQLVREEIARVARGGR